MTKPARSMLRSASLSASMLLALFMGRTSELRAADPPTSTASPESLDAADALYRRGVEAFKSGDLPRAERAFAEAYAMKPSVEIAANLGVVELKLGRFRDAAEHLANALRAFPIRANPEARAQLEAKLDEARAKVATVALDVSPAGATVEVDGRTIGTAPVALEVFVEPGSRRFSASLEGHAPMELTLPFEAGTRRKVALTLQRAAEGLPMGSPSNSSSPTDEGSPRLWPIVGASAGIAVGLGLGIGFLVRSLDLESTLATARCNGPSDCETRYGGDVADLNTSRALAGTGFGLAGLGAAGLAFVLLWQEDEAPAVGTVSIAPVTSPTEAGLVVRARF